jgi:hypothetical protein
MITDFRVRGYAGARHPRVPVGTLLVETVHHGEASAYVTVTAWQQRMRCGEVGKIELIDCRTDGKLTDLDIGPSTQVPWSWETSRK